MASCVFHRSTAIASAVGSAPSKGSASTSAPPAVPMMTAVVSLRATVARQTPGMSTDSHRRALRPLKAAQDVPAATVTLSDDRKKALAREFVETGSGYFTSAREELFADDFVFRGPIIGPLNKKDYMYVLGTFKLYEAFSDLKSNSWGYSIDPLEPNRVWFFVRQTGVNTGQFTLNESLKLPPSGKEVFGAPEAHSILLNDQGKVRLLTVGYVVDFDAPKSNAGRSGAAVGLINGAGLPVPILVGKALRPMQILARSLRSSGADIVVTNSEWDELPQWYKNYVPERREGCEGAPGF